MLSDKEVDTPCKNRKEISKEEERPIQFKDKHVKLTINVNSEPKSESVSSSAAVTPSIVLPLSTVYSNNSSASSTPLLVSPGAGTFQEKKINILPPRSTASSIDLLDTILVKQDRLLADKYKSDQEKSNEKQLFELQKRKMSSANWNAPIQVEKRTQKFGNFYV